MAGVVNNEGPPGYLDTLEALSQTAQGTSQTAQSAAETALVAATDAQAKAQEALDAVLSIIGAPDTEFTPLIHVQSVPAATWSIPHDFGVAPSFVATYIDGELVDPDVHTDESYVVLTFALPASGKAHIR